MNLRFLSCITAIAPVMLVMACASPKDLLQESPALVFASALRAPALSTCIDRNTDGAYGNSLRTNIKNPEPEVIEIVVRNGDFVYAVVRIRAEGAGSTATFNLGGAATITPEASLARMTKGCA